MTGQPNVTVDLTFQGLCESGRWEKTGVYWASHHFVNALQEVNTLKLTGACHQQYHSAVQQTVSNLPISRYGSACPTWLPQPAQMVLWWWQQLNLKLSVVPDVYHSLFLPLPHFQVSKTQQPVKFITIFDVIPLVRPQWSSWQGRMRMQQTLDSISPQDWVICTSKQSRDDFLQLRGHPSQRCVVVPLGVTNRIQPAANQPPPQNVEAPFFLVVGAAEPRKNLKRVLASYRAASASGELGDTRLTLVGPRSQAHQDLQQLVSEDPFLNQRVRWAYNVDSAELNALYHNATALVYPSLYEGFGLPILEAMQAGTPVLTSSQTACEEIALEAAVCVLPTDADAISQGMVKLVQDSTLRERCRQRGFERVKQYGWDTITAQTRSLYDTALSQR